jgi:MFS family permease
MPSGADSTSAGPSQTVPGARAALAVLIAINLFNYIDRQVLSAVLPRLESDGSIIDPSDPNPKFKLGLLTSAFLLTYVLCSPVFGWLDGRGFRRWVLLGVAVSLWSLASGASGLATGYAMLLATRCLVGIGEAAYAPVASAMLSDAYPADRRGPVLAGFNLAIPVGSALGFVIGGTIADYSKDWRPAFYFTFSGLLLGLLCFTRRELPRTVPVSPETAPSYVAVLKRLTTIKSFVLCCLGMTAITFVLGGVAVWIGVYFFQREARFEVTPEVLTRLERKLPAEEVGRLRPLADGRERTYAEMKTEIVAALGAGAGAHADKVYEEAATPASPKPGDATQTFGVILVVGGLVSTVAGAWAGEVLRRRGVRGAYFLVSAAGAILALPFFLGILYAPPHLSWACVFVAIFGLFLYTGPGNTILANVVSSEVRATAFAINVLVIHILGDVISPPIIGAVADATSLQLAFALTSSLIAVAAVLWLWGARHLDADTAAAEAVTPPSAPAGPAT